MAPMTGASLSRHVHERLAAVALPRGSQPRSDLTALADDFIVDDAYFSLQGIVRGQLPALDWSNDLKKSYSIAFWMRANVSSDTLAESPPTQRLLYRFATDANPERAEGVSVSLGEWVFKENQVQTMLTATSLPLLSSTSALRAARTAAGPMLASASMVQVPLKLSLGEWHLVVCTHVFPYLKRPEWSLIVDGELMGKGELPYPVLPPGGLRMDYNVVLQNVTEGGVVMVGGVSKPDDAKTASELQEAIEIERRPLSLDIAALAIYRSAMSPTAVALAAEAGPALAQQQAGRILPVLPPVANWCKGSSIEAGPKVGIPLVVHAAAMSIQKAAGEIVFGISAVEAHVLGDHRLVARMRSMPGSTEQTPRVGLMQPGPVLRQSPDEEDWPSLYLTGGVKLTHGVRDYCARMAIVDADCSLHWSVVAEEQGLAEALVLPFFLSLCPPGKVYERQDSLYADSIRQLYALYSDNGQYAGQLIALLADWIAIGGARVQETVLQNGLIHVLASSLRLSLLRASRVRFFREPPESDVELARRFTRLTEDTLAPSNPNAVGTAALIGGATCPRFIPTPIIEACAKLIGVCCGPPASRIDDLTPAMRVRRTSDLALTSIFGLALDLDLFGGDAAAGQTMFAAIAERYGGFCLTFGYILRSQVSVQYFLDAIRLRYDSQTPSAALELVGAELSRLMAAMLLASLSNRRSVSQAEHDLNACMGALSDCPLGRMGAHVVLNAIVGVLAWCEILPVEAAPLFDLNAYHPDEDQKMQVASRLGRNLLISEFHDVVSPMVLSRTVFSAESSMARPSSADSEGQAGSLSWENHWRLSLLLFSWVASIAGPEGLVAAKSSGSLLLASALAGSLHGAMSHVQKPLISALYLPPPGMALMIGSTLRSEWSYTDLLADRLQIMMPLLPGLVVSLLSHPSDSSADSVVAFDSLRVLGEVLTSVGGAFHRVFGGVIHSTDTPRSHLKLKRDGSSESVKAAKTYVPNLLVVAIFLEHHINLRSPLAATKPVKVSRPEIGRAKLQQTDLDNWVEVSSAESVINEVTVALPSGEGDADAETTLSVLHSCGASVLNTAAGMISNAMGAGGSGATVSLWQSILATVDESVLYAARGSAQDAATKPSADSTWRGEAQALALNVLCRLVAMVLMKALKRHDQWEVWSFELCSAVSKVCLLIEEKQLLKTTVVAKTMSDDQVILLSTLLEVLSYGRDATGWCQLSLPSMTSSLSDSGRSHGPHGDLSAASKLLLPVLRPSLRIVLNCLESIPALTEIEIESDEKQSPVQSLLHTALAELDPTLTAAIVGLAFSGARDVALNAMALLRKASTRFMDNGNTAAALACRSLICKVAEELRVRYEGERRLRETALFDAYEDDAKRSSQDAAEESNVVERLILGGDVLGVDGQDVSEEISFDTGAPKRKRRVSDDFVLFHEPGGRGDGEASSRLGYAQYEGLGSTLEECKILLETDSTAGSDQVVAALSSYLDSWDAAARREDKETEIVDLFGTAMQIKAGDTSSDGTLSSDMVKPLPILGSETAADSMSAFFEFAAAEKTRMKEISHRFLPSHRYSRMSFAERFCWARYMELATDTSELLWERGVTDGNRDIRSRLPTVPCYPQFRRYIPKYLDHYAGDSPGRTISAENPDHHHRRSSVPDEIDAFTRTLLEAGNLEIVDITKKKIEDEEPELDLRRPSGSVDEDDAAFLTDNVSEMGSERLNRGEEEIKPASEDKDSQEGSTNDLAAPSEDLSLPTDDLTGLGGSDNVAKGQHSITTSAFATPPDNASSSLGLLHSAAAGMIEHHLENCLHVKAEGSRPCTVLLTATHLVIEYEGDPEGFFEGEVLAVQEDAERQRIIKEAGEFQEQSPEELFNQRSDRRLREIASLRPKSIRWNLSEISHVYLRRYRLRDSSLELFFIPSGGTAYGDFGLYSPSTSIFLDFGPGREGHVRRDDAAFAIMQRSPPQAIKQWPDRSAQFLHDQLSRLTMGWVEGRITNFDYLLHLNMLSGRSYNDICQYPVFPWVLADYTSEEIPDLTARKSFRDLSKPVGALNEVRLNEFLERFNTFADPSIPPFMYGSHYSTSAGVVLHFLVRLHPFAGLHRQLQSGHFDVADRLFSSVPRTWSMCTGTSAAEVKELTPEWYCNPTFLKNVNAFKLGTSQDGDVLGDVELPPWAKGSPEKFIEVMRAALESDVCSAMLPDWIDLVFGRKQQGPEAIKANNVFFYLTYYGSVDVASIKDDALRQATELQIAHFGQCPMQLFRRPHVPRLPREDCKLSFYQLLSTYSLRMAKSGTAEGNDEASADKAGQRAVVNRNVFGEPAFLPFFSAPLSHWVHLDAPPPGPHAPLVAVRFAGTDRCLAVDARGVFHCFRWAWRSEDAPIDSLRKGPDFDSGCFVAQRELPRFKRVPRLIHSDLATSSGKNPPAVAISKTLFAGRSVLLVLSDGDGRGGIGMQLVDPSKAQVRGEVLVPAVHGGQISCIATETIGTAAGHGGVGGELALFGSTDGCASLWRFMSSHYLPLRPRIRLRGQEGFKISAVGLCSTTHIAATLSTEKCCLHTIGNGSLLRSFGPPKDTLGFPKSDDTQVTTKFADTPALAVSVQGYVVTVCESLIVSGSSERTVVTLHLFTLEGVSVGSKPLESWRGLPHKMQCTPDGTAVLVCCGRGITVHRLSACEPLEILDEWQITESDSLGSEEMEAAFDIDLGPSLNRPVVAATACSNGVLRLHALPGISAWSERHKKSNISQTVGSALAKPAQRFNQAVREGLGLGRQLAGMGRDIGREVTTDVKERGVGGFLNNFMNRKGSS